MMRLECYRIHEDVTLPKLATQGSACFDVHAYIKPTIPVVVYGMDNKKEEVLPLDGPGPVWRRQRRGRGQTADGAGHPPEDAG